MPERAGWDIAAPRRILVAGYYGYGNIGDEAILRSLLHDLSRQVPGAEFQVMLGRGGGVGVKGGAGGGAGGIGGASAGAVVDPVSSETASPARTSPRVRYLPRLKPLAIVRAMRGSDMLLLGGGTLIQDVTSVRSLAYYLALIWVAKRMRLPVAVYGGGLGPVRSSVGRGLAARVLPQVDLLTLRDRWSMDVALDLGVPAERLLLTADPAFSLDFAAAAGGAAQVEAALRAAGVPEAAQANLLLLALRPPVNPGDQAAVVEAVRAAVSDLGLFPLFVPFHPEHDLPLLTQLGAAAGVDHGVLRDVRDPALLYRVVSRARAMVAMRLHGVIFAVAAGVPCVALSYDPKVDALADDVPAIRYASYPGIDAAELAGHIAGALAAGPELVDALRDSAAALRERAKANAGAVAGLLHKLP